MQGDIKKYTMKTITRCFRINPILDKQLAMIAHYEDRTISKIINRLLLKAVEEYFRKNPEVYETVNNIDAVNNIDYE